jgi:hypothetical protein
MADRIEAYAKTLLERHFVKYTQAAQRNKLSHIVLMPIAAGPMTRNVIIKRKRVD